jgi:hypothetical protein
MDEPIPDMIALVKALSRRAAGLCRPDSHREMTAPPGPGFCIYARPVLAEILARLRGMGYDRDQVVQMWRRPVLAMHAGRFLILCSGCQPRHCAIEAISGVDAGTKLAEL